MIIYVTYGHYDGYPKPLRHVIVYYSKRLQNCIVDNHVSTNVKRSYTYVMYLLWASLIVSGI